MNTSNKKTSPMPIDSITRRKFLVQVGGAGAFVAAAGIPIGRSFAANDAQASPLSSPFWYDAPAKDWQSAIPIGNGRIGGMIFGGVQDD
jgi:alpha-L-fucosidase 2